jgi:diguanylate cyclase (GGDEF)-like protein
LTALTVLIGGVAQYAERQLSSLALRIYDDGLMSVSYLRSAQVGVATFAAQREKPSKEQVANVLSDLGVARDRATSKRAQKQAETLLTQVTALLAAGNPRPEDERRQLQAEVQHGFEQLVETFAADGFRYRRDVGRMVQIQLNRTTLVVAASVLAALILTALLNQSITPPIRQALGIAEAIAGGRLDNAIPLGGRGETAQLLRALHTMQASIASAMARIHQLMEDQATSHAGQLAAQHARMEAALDNMTQGLCLFGADGRLGVANSRFAEMFGKPADFCRPAELMSEDSRAPLLDATSGQGPQNSTCELPDGRVIAVSWRRIRDGGWVTTYDDITERRAAEARLAHMARHDALTGLPNRLALTEYMPQALARARRGGGLALLCMDLDRFKVVNDTLGHAAGDRLLCAVTQRLKECTREMDFVVRLGGDEFAIVQNGLDQPNEATALARRVVQEMARPFDVDGQVVVVGASVGIALAQHGLATLEALLKCGDLALYRAKEDGRGRFRFFEAEMDARMRDRRMIELDLRDAVALRQFEVFYQPLVNTSAGAISGFEALLRWRHPQRGLVSPAVFIPVAEDIGLISTIGAWVLQQACADAAKWPDHLKVAVNLSPDQFRGRGLVDEVANALASSGLPASRLELEITESILIQDDEAVLATLHALRTLGARIAMDDFGTGYSSLGYLQRFPFDKIKIDKSFVYGMADQTDCLAIVRAVIGLGRALGIAVNAEGVETIEQHDALRREGCDELQGYLFSRPRPVAEIPAMLSDGATLALSTSAARAGSAVARPQLKLVGSV